MHDKPISKITLCLLVLVAVIAAVIWDAGAGVEIVNEGGGSTPFAVIDASGQVVSRHQREDKAIEAAINRGGTHWVVRDGRLRIHVPPPPEVPPVDTPPVEPPDVTPPIEPDPEPPVVVDPPFDGGWLARELKPDAITVPAGGDVAAAIATGRDVVLRGDYNGNLTLRAGQQVRSDPDGPRRKIAGVITMANDSQVVGVESIAIRATGVTDWLIEDVKSIPSHGGFPFEFSNSKGTLSRSIGADAPAGRHAMHISGDQSDILIIETVFDGNGRGMKVVTRPDGTLEEQWDFHPNAYVHAGKATFRRCLISNGGHQAVRPGGVLVFEHSLLYANPIQITLNNSGSKAIGNVLLNANDRRTVELGWPIGSDWRTDGQIIDGNVIANPISRTTIPGIRVDTTRAMPVVTNNRVFVHSNQAGHAYTLNGAAHDFGGTNKSTTQRLDHGQDIPALIARERDRPHGVWTGDIEAARLAIIAAAMEALPNEF